MSGSVVVTLRVTSFLTRSVRTTLADNSRLTVRSIVMLCAAQNLPAGWQILRYAQNDKMIGVFSYEPVVFIPGFLRKAESADPRPPQWFPAQPRL